MPQNIARTVVIIGAGTAGLTAAYDLSKAAVKPIALEKDMSVEDISRTVNDKGFHFDTGDHRFFNKIKAVEEMWHEVPPRIFTKGARCSPFGDTLNSSA